MSSYLSMIEKLNISPFENQIDLEACLWWFLASVCIYGCFFSKCLTAPCKMGKNVGLYYLLAYASTSDLEGW